MPTPFISRQDLTDYLGRDVTTDDGALACVDAACDACRTIAEQTFNRGTTTDTFDGTGTDALLLPELPINSVSTVAVSDSSAPPVWTTAGTADYTLNGNGVLLATDTAGTSLFGAVWPARRQNIRVTYDHGYTVGTAGDVPADVRMVALSIASRLLIQGPSVFEVIGENQVRYGLNASDYSAGELRILRKYRQAK